MVYVFDIKSCSINVIVDALFHLQAAEFAEHSHSCYWSLVGSHWPT